MLENYGNEDSVLDLVIEVLKPKINTLLNLLIAEQIKEITPKNNKKIKFKI